MIASGHRGEVQAIQATHHQLSRMTDGRGCRPSGDLRIRDLDAIGQLIGESAEPAAKHYGDARLTVYPGANECGRGVDHSSMPAMQADRKFAIVPAATAFKPRRARSDLRFGANAPMPPI